MQHWRFCPPVAGHAIITVCEITGKTNSSDSKLFGNFRQEFRLSGLKNGFYLINVKGNNYRFSGKLISNGKSNGTYKIEKISTIIQKV